VNVAGAGISARGVDQGLKHRPAPLRSEIRPPDSLICLPATLGTHIVAATIAANEGICLAL
jgi:hypothetical protein